MRSRPRSRSRSASTASAWRSRCERPRPARTRSWRSASCSARRSSSCPTWHAWSSAVETRSEKARIADVRLRADARRVPGWQRRFYATSSCGICGKESIEAVRVAAAPLAPGPQIDAAVLAALPGELRSRQRTFERTGGLHAAGALHRRRDPRRAARGRRPPQRRRQGHRADGDGRAAPARTSTSCWSPGALSFEITQKALVAGIPVLAAVSAPSSLAVRLARESGHDARGLPARR